MTTQPSYLNFDQSTYLWKPNINYREYPESYRVGKGEQGVLICEPYKSEIGQFWRFKDPEIATASSAKITAMFYDFMDRGDFVGADMTRKFLQMGYTRARRYANYKGGRKYDPSKGYQLLERGTGDAKKAESAAIFYQCWKQVEAHEPYKQAKQNWKKQFG